MRVIELFSGIGVPRMALRNCGIDIEELGISEIDNNAIKMYNNIHGKTNNFGDISKIKELPECDFLWASSPCTSFSHCGRKDGLKGESGLLLEVERLLKNYKDRNCIPKYFGFENVIEIEEKFPEVFNQFIDLLENIGYNIYWEKLNALYFDCPQKRERLFLMGIRKDIDKNKFKMPKNGKPTEKRLKDLLLNSNEIPDDFKHPEERMVNRHFRIKPIPENTLQTIELGYYFTEKSKKRAQSNRIYSKEGICPTLTTTPFINIEEEAFLRKAMPIEYWRAMGISDEDYYSAAKEQSMTALIKAAGNSICLPILEKIFKELFESQSEN